MNKIDNINIAGVEYNIDGIISVNINQIDSMYNPTDQGVYKIVHDNKSVGILFINNIVPTTSGGPSYVTQIYMGPYKLTYTANIGYIGSFQDQALGLSDHVNILTRHYNSNAGSWSAWKYNTDEILDKLDEHDEDITDLQSSSDEYQSDITDLYKKIDGYLNNGNFVPGVAKSVELDSITVYPDNSGKINLTGIIEDGKSAYQIWLELGHQGTEYDFLEWLNGCGFETKAVQTLPTGNDIDQHTIYAAQDPDSDPETWTEWVRNELNNDWIPLATHDGSGLSGALADIVSLKDANENLIAEILHNRLKLGYQFDNNIIQGKFYNTSNGRLTVSSDNQYDCSPLLKLNGTSFMWGGVYALGSGYWYDENKEPLTRFTGTRISPVNIPTGAAYLGLNFDNLAYPNGYSEGYILTDSILRQSLLDVFAIIQDEQKRITQKTDMLTLVKSNNMLNPLAITSGMVNADGSISDTGIGANYNTTDFIAVEPNNEYSIINANANIVTNYRAYAFYNADKLKIAYNNQTQDNSFNTEGYADVAFARITFSKSIDLTNVSIAPEGSEFDFYEQCLQYEDDREYEDSDASDIMNKRKVASAIIAAINSIEINRFFEFDVIESSNNVNPDEIVTGFLQNAININSNLTGYNTSGFIPVNPNTTYKLLKSNNESFGMRSCAFYDGSKNTISYENLSALPTVKTTPDNENVAYMRFSYYASVGKTIGLFEDTEDSYSEYGNKVDIKLKEKSIPLEEKNESSVVTKKDLEQSIRELTTPTSSLVTMTKNGISLDFTFDDIIMKTTLDKDTTNNIFDFVQIKKGSGRWYTMGDEVSPGHLLHTALGGNHAQPCSLASITSHGLDNTAIGTAWSHSNGHTYYIIKIVDENNVIFLSSNEGTVIEPNFVELEVGVLTRDNLTLTVGSVSSTQMYPSTKNIVHKILLDGVDEVVDDGSYQCRFVDIVESYDVTDPISVLNNIISRAGTNAEPSMDGDTLIKFKYTYRFLPGGTVLVFATYVPQRDMYFHDFLFSQSRLPAVMNASYYIPNAKKISDVYDFVKPKVINWSSQLPFLYISRTYFEDENNPVNRVVTYGLDFGFALGFLTNFGVGANLKDLTNVTFEIRNNTGKIYPWGVSAPVVGTTLRANTIYNGAMYRAIIPNNTNVDNRMSMYHFDLNEEEFVWVDYSDSMIDHVKIDSKLNGKHIEVIESRNAVLLTDIYNEGFYVEAGYVDGETCFLVAKIK